jgi:hypothetical protein
MNFKNKRKAMKRMYGVDVADLFVRCGVFDNDTFSFSVDVEMHSKEYWELRSLWMKAKVIEIGGMNTFIISFSESEKTAAFETGRLLKLDDYHG